MEGVGHFKEDCLWSTCHELGRAGRNELRQGSALSSVASLGHALKSCTHSQAHTGGRDYNTDRQITMNFEPLFLFLTALGLSGDARKLPSVPSVVHPPTPEEARLTLDHVNFLQDSDQDPEVKPGLFEGDMALDNEVYSYWRVGLRWDVFPERLWQNNTVPYVISPLYDTEDYVTIYSAIQTLNFMTCVKFVPWNGKAKDFLLIWPIKFPKGCWSFVGRYGGAQIVSLQPPDRNGPNCLGGEGRSIHELMHALGIFHEQSRADRDEFIEVHLDNVIPEFKVNFDKQSMDNTTYSFEYDYESIMHYGKYYFSKGRGLPTIVPKSPDVKLGQRKAMSKTDCLKINDLYGCLDKSVYSQRKYYTLCSVMGL